MMRFKNSTNLILSIVIITLSLVAINSYFAIKYLKLRDNPRWPREAFRYNASIGYEMSPSFSSIMLDESFFINSHKLGYRIPNLGDSNNIERDGILSVGCSFTYGDGVEAEQTFSYLVADNLQLASYNYGVCSYSYASVILQLKELKQQGILDTLRPNMLILGTTNWLIERSLNFFMPTDDASIGVYPYIAKKAENIEIAKPPKIFSIKYPPRRHSNEKTIFGLDFKRFYLMSLIVPQLLYANFIKKIYTYEKSNINSFELYDFVITEIKKIISPYQMKFIILWMPVEENEHLEEGLKKAVEKHSDVILVNGIDAIKKYNIKSKEYIHIHPRPKAHQAYAREILAKIRELYKY